MTAQAQSTPAFLKLTFNKPATTAFFEGMDACAIQVEVTGETVMFKPVNQETGEKVVRITQRMRGGTEALVEGSLVAALAAALPKPHDKTYFMLSRVSGWIVATPYVGTKQEPPRFEPHVRVWSKGEVKPTSAALITAVQHMSQGQLFTAIRDAEYLTAWYDSHKKPGRPPRDVSQARELLQVVRGLFNVRAEYTLGQTGVRTNDHPYAAA